MATHYVFYAPCQIHQWNIKNAFHMNVVAIHGIDNHGRCLVLLMGTVCTFDTPTKERARKQPSTGYPLVNKADKSYLVLMTADRVLFLFCIYSYLSRESFWGDMLKNAQCKQNVVYSEAFRKRPNVIVYNQPFVLDNHRRNPSVLSMKRILENCWQIHKNLIKICRAGKILTNIFSK